MTLHWQDFIAIDLAITAGATTGEMGRLGNIEEPGVIVPTNGLPQEGMGLILALDRVLDMCRTNVNVFCD